jgi:hypothetical protein
MSRTIATPLERLLIVLTVASIALAGLAVPAAAQPSQAPDTPVCMTLDPSVDPATCGDGATAIDPDPGVLDPRPIAWDHIVVAPDGRSLTVYFWMGVQECNGLHSVVVTPTDTGIDVSVLVGIPEGAASRICIELAQLYRTTVVLDAPLVANAA